MSHFFDTSKYSIARAKHHISDFERQSCEFFATDPYSRVVEVEPDTREKIHKVKLTKPMPVALPAIASDAVNNLRSALDHAVYGITLASGVSRTYFPFADNAANFQNAVKGRCKELPKEIVDLLCAFQPYKEGNTLLWALNELSNTNKHAIICPVALVSSGLDIKRGGFIGSGWSISMPVWNRTKNEMEIFRVSEGCTAQMDFDFTTYIAISDVEFLDGQPADIILNQFVRIVEGIVMALEVEACRIGLL